MHERLSHTTLKQRMVATLAVFFVASCCVTLFPTNAFASTSDTDFTLQCSDDQIKCTAPTTVPLTFDGDGKFICPTKDNFKITNDSIFPICVKSWTSETSNASIHALSDEYFEDESTNDTLNAYYLMTAIDGTSINLNLAESCDATATADWNIAVGSSLKMNLSGAIKNLSGVDFVNTPVDLLTVTWVISAAQNTI